MKYSSIKNGFSKYAFVIIPVLILVVLGLVLYIIFKKNTGLDIDCDDIKKSKPMKDLHPNNAILKRTMTSDHKYLLEEKLPYVNSIEQYKTTSPIYTTTNSPAFTTSFLPTINPSFLPTVNPEDADESGDEDEDENSKEYKDYNRPFKDATTNFVIQELFSTSDTLFNFLSLVITSHEDELKKYITDSNLQEEDLIFLYKGGNLIRIIANEMLKKIPLKGKVLLNNFYKSYFKRSDADFTIYINTNKFKLDSPEFLKIAEDVGNISYNLQKKFRSEFFLKESEKYFNFFRYNNQYQVRKLNSHVNNYSESFAIANPENKKYYNAKVGGLRMVSSLKTIPSQGYESKFWNSLSSNEPPGLMTPSQYIGKQDLIITIDGIPDPNNLNIMIKSDPENSNINWPIYVQNNTALIFPSVQGLHHFDLVRSKVAIDYEVSLWDPATNTNTPSITNSVGGELIDVSIGKDMGVEEFFEAFDLNCKRYTLSHQDQSFSFNGYSIKYLIDDLNIILFHEHDYPWEDAKYSKRLFRLCLLCFIEVMSVFNNIKDSKKYMENICYVYKLLVHEGKSANSKVEKHIKKIKNKYPNMFYNFILNETLKMLNNIPESQLSEYNIFNSNILESSKVNLESIGDINEYICDQGSININNLYIGDFDSLL